ncbi:MAG: hypothetical protein ACP5N3_04190 [Candidatus Nanoarchaeia archaeon]
MQTNKKNKTESEYDLPFGAFVLHLIKSIPKYLAYTFLFLIIIILSSFFVKALTGYEYLANNTIAYWSFDADANDTVNNTGVWSNTASKINTSCIYGSCYQFDGSSDYIISKLHDNNISANYSVVFWAYVNDTSNNQAVMTTTWYNQRRTKMLIQARADAPYSTSTTWYSQADLLNGTSTSLYTWGANSLKETQWQCMIFTYNASSYVGQSYLNASALSGTQRGTPAHQPTSFDIPLVFGAKNESGSLNYFFTGTLDEVGIFNKVLTPAEINFLCNTTISFNTTRQYPFNDSSPAPGIDYTPVWNSQSPSDITVLNIIGTRLNITYNYTDTNITNTTSIILNYTLPRTIYENGTAETSTYTKIYNANLSNITYQFLLDDNEVYPGTYNLDEEVFDNTAHNYLTQSATTDLWKVELLNVSNTTVYNIFEVMLNTTGLEEMYYCNSSYTTGQPQLNTNCYLFETFSGTGFNHTHNNSKHNAFSLPINTTSGTAGSVKVTSTSYFVFKRLNGTTTLGYINNGSRASSHLLSLNNGATYTANNTITIDLHLHQYGLTDVFTYNACYTNNSGTRLCSITRNDTYDISPLPPTSPSVLSPINTEYYYNQTIIQINWTTSTPYTTSVNISGYNLSLLNEDLTFNQSIIYTTSTQNQYDATEITITGYDSDSGFPSGYGLMSNKTITNNNKLVNNVTYQQKSSSGNSDIIVQFVYTDGTVYTTGATQEDTSYVARYQNNPYPLKPVSRIQIWGGCNSASYTAYYRYLTFNFNGYTPNNQYNWTNTITEIGGYRIKAEAIDTNSLTNYGIGDSFNLTSIINLMLKNAYSNAVISNFSGWIYNNPTGANTSYTANGNISTNKLYQGLNTIYITHPSYSTSNSNFYNLTINNTGTTYNYNFSLYTKNSIYIQIKDESTYNLINQSIILEVQYLNTTINTTSTTNGIIFLENLSDGEYTLVFRGDTGVNYTSRTYVVTVLEDSTQFLTAYLTNSGTTVLLTILDSYTGNLIEGASISLYRYINSTYTLVEIKNSDITGRAQFVYVPLATYRFVVQNTGYLDKIFDLNPIIFASYNVPIDREITYVYTGSLEDVQITYTPHQFFANETINFTWIITSVDGVLNEYGVNLTFPCGNKTFTGNNSIGETYTTTFSITCAKFMDTMNITYYYTSVGNDRKTYREYYYISGTYSGSNYTWINIGRNANTYGLGDLERIFIVTFLVLIVAGTVYLIVGGIGSIVMALLIFGYFSWTGFIPFWSIAISVIAGIFILIGGKE